MHSGRARAAARAATPTALRGICAAAHGVVLAGEGTPAARARAALRQAASQERHAPGSSAWEQLRRRSYWELGTRAVMLALRFFAASRQMRGNWIRVSHTSHQMSDLSHVCRGHRPPCLENRLLVVDGASRSSFHASTRTAVWRKECGRATFLGGSSDPCAPHRAYSAMRRVCAGVNPGIYVLPQLLTSDELARANERARALGAVVCDAREDANLLLTAMRAPRRLERHVSADERVRESLTQQTKPIASLAWLDACAEEGVSVSPDAFRVYPSVSGPTKRSLSPTEDAKETAEKKVKQAPASPTAAVSADPSPELSPTRTSPASVRSDSSATPSPEGGSENEAIQEATSTSLTCSLRPYERPNSNPRSDHPCHDPPLPGWFGVPGDVPDEQTIADAYRHAPAWTNTELAVFRPTPLQSTYNQALVDELQLLRQHRRLTSDMYSEMAYMRAAAAVKAVPYALDTADDEALCALKGIGRKMAHVIRQFYARGSIAEADTVRADPAVQTLLRFTTLYSIGPRTAERAYNAGCRTLEDLTRHKSTALSTHLGVVESLALLPDLEQRIPRAEVVHIADQIMHQLRAFLPHAIGTIAGSFRRGAPTSGDVDLVVTAGEDEVSPGDALARLVRELRASGRVTHTVSLARRAHAHSHTHGVDVAQLVYRATPTSVHRRVDIVFAPRAQYGAALLGWTGSVLYERDLRRWARTRGYVVGAVLMQFAATGVTREADGVLMSTPSEASMYVAELTQLCPVGFAADAAASTECRLI